MIIKIPLKPMSVNEIFQGRRYKTRKYKDWRQSFGELLRYNNNIKSTIEGFINIDIKFYIQSFRLRDVDNMVKGVQDALVENEAIEDDRFIKKLTAEKFEVKNKEDVKIEIRIKKCKLS